MTVKVSERAFQGWVTDCATRFGWRWWHIPAPMRWDSKRKTFVPAQEGAGLPDLILIHDDPPRLVFAEVKGEKGKLSEAQQEFLRMARDVAEYCRAYQIPTREQINFVGTYVWQPGQEQAIEDILRSRTLI